MFQITIRKGHALGFQTLDLSEQFDLQRDRATVKTYMYTHLLIKLEKFEIKGQTNELTVTEYQLCTIVSTYRHIYFFRQILSPQEQHCTL